jgi:hypothetical protein
VPLRGGGETSFPHGKPLPAVAEKLRGMQHEMSDCGWRNGRVVTPGGCQIGYMDHTGCHQLVF